MNALNNYIEQTARMDRILKSLTRPAYMSIFDSTRHWTDLVDGPARVFREGMTSPADAVRDSLAVTQPKWAEYFQPHPALASLDRVVQVNRTALDQALGVNNLTKRALDLFSHNAFLDSLPSWPARVAIPGGDLTVWDDDGEGVLTEWGNWVADQAEDFWRRVRLLSPKEQRALAGNIAWASTLLVLATLAVTKEGGFAAVSTSAGLAYALWNLANTILALYEDDSNE